MLMPGSVLIIPQFMIWARLGFTDSYVPLIVPAFLGGGAFYIFLFRQFMLTIPRDMDEAALIDGAGRLKILISIIIPSIKPAIIVVALMAFITNWNDMLGPVIYLNTPEKLTMSYGISRFSGQFNTNYSFVMVAATLTMLPVFIMYLIGQEYFIEGIVLSGLKE
jgi:multiple sugar transport system permease protein